MILWLGFTNTLQASLQFCKNRPSAPLENLELFVALLACTILLAVISERWKVAFPILLTTVGIVVSLIPGLPVVELRPDVVLLVFLPPLLYSAAWFTSWEDFWTSRRSIGLLALGYILFSSSAVAVVAHLLIPGISWAGGFLLGAVLAPPDAVAAVSILRDKHLPKRIKAILEGESLVNDATALIAYRFALAAVVSGTFSLGEASAQFVFVAMGGLVIGLVVAYAIYYIHRFINNSPTVDTTFTLVTPFIPYLLAEHFHMSGVLAVVTCGLFLSRKSSVLFSNQTRLQAVNTWSSVIFLLEGTIFMLIGLQMNIVLAQFTVSQLIGLLGVGLVISIAIVVFRIMWVYPGAYLPRILVPSIRKREARPHPKQVFFIGWTAIRGVVSLATALAIPHHLPDGSPFPYRYEILSIAFVVIIFTLFVNGLALPWLIKKLGIRPTDHELLHENSVRLKLAQHLVEHIEENYSYGQMGDGTLALVKSKYENRLQRLYDRFMSQLPTANGATPEPTEMPNLSLTQFLEVQKQLVNYERGQLLQLRKQKEIDDSVFRQMEAELDMEELRLDSELGVRKKGH